MIQTKTLVLVVGGAVVFYCCCCCPCYVCVLQSQILNVYQLCTDEMTLVPRDQGQSSEGDRCLSLATKPAHAGRWAHSIGKKE